MASQTAITNLQTQKTLRTTHWHHSSGSEDTNGYENPLFFEGNLMPAQQMLHSWVTSKQLPRQRGNGQGSPGNFAFSRRSTPSCYRDAAEILGRGTGLGKTDRPFAGGRKRRFGTHGLGPKNRRLLYSFSVSEPSGVVIRITCRWMDVDKRKLWRLDYAVAKTSTDFSVEGIARDCCFPPNDIASSLPIAVMTWCRTDLSSRRSGHHRQHFRTPF